MNIAAAALGVTAMALCVSTLALDKSLPYRIDPGHYVQYLWVPRLAWASLAVSVVAIVCSVAARRLRAFLLSLFSLVSLVAFIGGVHSGPMPNVWCYLNLERIDRAKGQLVRDAGLAVGATITTDQIARYIEGQFRHFKCAEGGTLSIGRVGEEPRCSFHGSISQIEAALMERVTTDADKSGAQKPAP